MVNNICNLMSIIIMILFLAAPTIASWIVCPIIPEKTELRTCRGWFIHHAFGDNLQENQRLSSIRNRSYDAMAYVVTATYAQLLSSLFFMRNFDIDFMCRTHVGNTSPFQYTAAKDTYFTCYGWLMWYGYGGTIVRATQEDYNFYFKNRRMEEDVYLHIWTAIFIRYVHNEEGIDTLPADQFCSQLNNISSNDEKPMPFMSLNDSVQFCHAWITLQGYHHKNYKKNYHIAINRNVLLDPYLSSWTTKYAEHIDTIHDNFKETGIKKAPFTPVIFCQRIGRPYPMLLNYYESDTIDDSNNDNGGNDDGNDDSNNNDGGYVYGGYDQSGYVPGGYNQSGYVPGGYVPGGYDQGGYASGSYDQGGYNQGGYSQGGYNQGGSSQGGYDQSGYVLGGFDYSSNDYGGNEDDDNNKEY